MLKRRLPSSNLLAALAVGLVVTSFGMGHGTPATGGPADPWPSGERSDDQTMAAAWKEVERLLSEQKLRQALEEVRRIATAVRGTGEADARVRAVIAEAQILTALGGFESAVEFLDQADRPPGDLQQATLDLYYAHGLINYLRIYSWEIGQRERVAASDDAPFTAWTADQIVAEAHRTIARVWQGRESWGAEPLGKLGEYLEQNSYPARIRGTLRDAISYLWTELLADSSLWRPEQSSRLYALDLEALVAGEGASAEELASPEVHPLARMATVLADLESWHRRGGRPEAVFEARRELLARLRGSFTRQDDRRLLAAALETAVEALGRRYPWWSMGMAERAEWVRDLGDPDSLIGARKLALEGRNAHPESLGGQRCRYLVAAIEAPDYSLAGMATDAPGRRSILISHRNLEALFLRAYRIDLERRVASGDDYRLLGDAREAERITAGRPPDFEWRLELPPTPDYRSHQTFVTPPMEESGLYLVVASADRFFRQRANELQALEMVVSDLVLLSRSGEEGLEVTVHSGADGGPLAGVEVDLYRADFRSGHHRVGQERTDSEGIVRFRPRDRQAHFLVARMGDQIALDPSYRSFWRRERPGPRTAALVYTDRSIYRPEQELFWKVVAYRADEEGGFGILPRTEIQVELVDPNNEVVASATARSNDFGSASGSFRVPSGRLLGQWSVRASGDGNASVRVEEYKRPTFEVTVSEPGESLRLNRPATIAGEARYYFGLPLAGGEVSWRVVREALYPRWWFQPPQATETIAAGGGQVGVDGSFRFTFTPQADERDATSGVTYRYRVEADVTDEAGETRSGSRSFRLGFVAVEARLEAGAAFFVAARPLLYTIVRSDLDGTPEAGTGRWRLVALEQPETTRLPADEPLPEGLDEGYQTAGDRLRPRWARDHSAAAALRGWQDGIEVASGTLEHGDDGIAELAVPGPAPGAYRLHYSTRDLFGAQFDTRTELVVVEAGGTDLRLAVVAMAERSSVAVGETARLLIHSGLPNQEMLLELFRDEERTERRRILSGPGPHLIEIPISERHRGGFGFSLTCLRDHQLMVVSGSVFVPWDDRKLTVELTSFRDLLRPGGKETWTIRLSSADETTLAAGTAELLAYMYDRSLDLFGPHLPPDPLGLYPVTTGVRIPDDSLGTAPRIRLQAGGFPGLPPYPGLRGDTLRFLDRYGIGGMGRRMYRFGQPAAAQRMQTDAVMVSSEARMLEDSGALKAGDDAVADAAASEAPIELRTDFSETAFWRPHLVVGDDGSASFEFTVPDSVTEWNVWVHALTRDLRAGSLTRQARSVKELMVRPYLPRFLREGDRLRVAVMVNNAGEEELSGTLDFDLLTPGGEASRNGEFGLEAAAAHGRPFRVAPGGSAELFFALDVPPGTGPVAVRVVGRAGALSDGELRELPVLPSRFHLAQSRFAALQGAERRALRFAELAAGDDPTRLDEQLVVTLDAQLFYGVLRALPYLTDYPYDCTEQLLNRFLSTGILATLYDDYPAVARMAEEFSGRETPLEAWDRDDPNLRMALEETPWLVESRGGEAPGAELIDVLDRRVARATRDASLARLLDAQTSSGGFPWWPGGPPSPYMTLYLLQGFSRALEHGVEVPRQPVVDAWGYLHRYYVDTLVRESIGADCCWEFVTFLNWVLSSYPDAGWTGDVFSEAERRRMLEFSFGHWRRHSPLNKAQLALTLARADRIDDARLVFDSVMDSSQTTRDEGTFWAPEDRAWLWYNDTIETHAFALRTLGELDPDDDRRQGLVHWLFLNKKLNHWKSTRATAEVLYALVHYLEREGQLGAREEVTVSLGPIEHRFLFEPDRYGPVVPHGTAVAGGDPEAVGRPNQIVVAAERIEPSMAEIVVDKSTPGLLFASATWQFSTDKLPDAASGDFFSVDRRFFRRVHDGREWTLEPLAEGDPVAVGDQVEVRLTVRTRHAAEYVHLRDPRGAGFEPESQTSRFRWNLGIGWYEEIRDSGTNFFFEWLPAGEVDLSYRVRAAAAGAFRVAPATLQSIYAPEFNAYSAGALLRIEPRE